MERVINANQPIRLQGTKNTRDLGGYPTKYGINTINGAFLRSDKPEFSVRDKDVLYRYGVRLIIDLRSSNEVKQGPCTMEGYLDVEYQNIQLLDNVMSGDGSQALPDTLVETYLDLIEHSKASFLKVFKKILEYKNECVLFNCTGGKDRTGVLSMMLLKLTGVPDEVVVADYAATYFNIMEDMERNMAMMKQMGMTIPEQLMYSEPENMVITLKHIKDNYGTMEAYLVSIGLHEEEIDALRDKLLGRSVI